MQIKHLGLVGALLMAAGNVAMAQVQLVYHLNGQAHVISETNAGRLIYRENGKMRPITGNGEWEIRPADSYATPLGSLDVTYVFEPDLLSAADQLAGKIQVAFRLEFRPEEMVRHLYYVCAWEVDGKLVEIRARTFFDAELKKTPWVFGRMTINASERRGRLRAYLLVGDRSLRGVSKENLDLTAFRAALDQGDTAAAASWLHGPGQGRVLPESLLTQAARLGDAGLLESALSGPNAKHLKGKDGGGLLVAAAESGRDACVSLLLQHGVDANADAGEGSALSRAAAAQSVECVEKLLAAGARPERDWDRINYNSLRRAIFSGNAKITRMLLDHGAKIPKDWANDLVWEAAANGYTELLTLFLERSPKPEALARKPQLDGKTPIMLAAFAGAEASVAVLQNAGASLTEAGPDGRTAAAWALNNDQKELAVKLLKQAPLSGAPASRLLHDSLIAGNDELVALLIGGDATLDPNAKDFDTVVGLVVRTGNLPVLNRALDRGLDVQRKFNRDWNLAGMAQRYHRPEVTAALEKHAGGPVERAMPKPEKLEVNVSQPGPMMDSRDLGKDFHGGQAEVDIYIDSEGVPHLPMLRSATDERLGRAALTNVLTWRFDRLPDKPNVWRRTIFPYDLPEPDATLRIAQSIIFWGERPWIDPDSMASPETVGEAGVKQGAWVRFVVTAKGEITKPEILAVTQPGIEDQVLEAMKSWHYYPAREGQQDIACPLECVVILPGKFSIPPNTFAFLGPKAPDDFPKRTPIDRDMRSPSQAKSGPASKNSLVMATFPVKRSGYPGKLTMLGSPSPTLAALAQATCVAAAFPSLIVDHKDVEYPMVMALVYRDESR